MSEESLNKMAPIIFSGFLLLTGIADAICAFIFYIKAQKKYENYLQTEGIISGIIKKKNRKGQELTYPLLKFSIGSNEYETENRYPKAPCNIKQGQPVTIIYNQNNPDEAEIKNKFMQFLIPITLTSGTLFAFIGAIIVYIAMSR